MTTPTIEELAAQYIIAGGKEELDEFFNTPQQKIIMDQMLKAFQVTPIQHAIRDARITYKMLSPDNQKTQGGPVNNTEYWNPTMTSKYNQVSINAAQQADDDHIDQLLVQYVLLERDKGTVYDTSKAKRVEQATIYREIVGYLGSDANNQIENMRETLKITMPESNPEPEIDWRHATHLEHDTYWGETP